MTHGAAPAPAPRRPPARLLARADEQGLRPDPDSVYGVLPLVFWTLVVIVSVKYVILVLRADNGGEGGTMALVSLVQGARLRSARAKWALPASPAAYFDLPADQVVPLGSSVDL